MPVVGISGNSSDDSFAVARYNSDGSLDATFGVGGTKVMDLGFRVEIAYDVERQADGKYILGGSVGAINSHDWGLVRFLSNGDLDNSFDQDGIAVTAITGNEDALTDLVLQPDGKILAAGSAGRFAGEFILS